jgi:hypothetical protein
MFRFAVILRGLAQEVGKLFNLSEAKVRDGSIIEPTDRELADRTS